MKTIRYFNPKQCGRFISQYALEKVSFQGREMGLELAMTRPLYTHNEEAIQRVLKEMTWPDVTYPIKIAIFNLPYNLPAFCNGVCTSAYGYNRERGSYTKEMGVFLLGRTTSIPIAMTEYALPHEIGHAFQKWYMPNTAKGGELWAEYKKIRGLKDRRGGASSAWHRSYPEIFANDFRYFFSPYQKDFWPHEVAHPSKVARLEKFFKTAWLKSQLQGRS